MSAQNFPMWFGRFMTGALIAALLAVGGVWFVVDFSLRGMEKAIDVTNERIKSVEVDMDGLRSEFSKLREDVGELKVGQAELRKDVEVLKKGQSELRADLTVFKREFAEFKQTMLEEFRATRDAIQKTGGGSREQLVPQGEYEFRIVFTNVKSDELKEFLISEERQIVISSSGSSASPQNLKIAEMRAENFLAIWSDGKSVNYDTFEEIEKFEFNFDARLFAFDVRFKLLDDSNRKIIDTASVKKLLRHASENKTIVTRKKDGSVFTIPFEIKSKI